MLTNIKNKIISIPAWMWLVLIIILGSILRIINLSTKPLWADEILSLSITRHFSHLIDLCRYLGEVEVHPPLYYILLHFWTGWFGFGNIAVRSLSVLFGIGCIWIGYLLGKNLFRSQKVGLVTALLISLLPLQIEYAQEARPYIIFCFFAGVSMLAVWKYLDEGKKPWLGLFVASSIIGMYLHYSYAFFWAAIALYWLFDLFWLKHEKQSRPYLIWMISNALVVLGFSFWLTPVIYKLLLASVPIFGLPKHFGPERQSDFFFYLIDQTGWASKLEKLSQFPIFIKFTAQLAIFAAFMFLVKNAVFSKQYKREILFLFWLFLAPMFFFLFSFQSAPYRSLIASHIIFITFPLALFLSFVICKFPLKIGFLLFSVLTISLIPYVENIVGNDAVFDPNYQFESAAKTINKLYRPGDVVVMVLGGMRVDLNYYLNDSIPVLALTPINYFGLDVLNTKQTLGLIENESNQLRYSPPSSDEINKKLERIDKMYHPKTYWIYGAENPSIKDWFINHNFRHGFRAINYVFELDSYSSKY